MQSNRVTRSCWVIFLIADVLLIAVIALLGIKAVKLRDSAGNVQQTDYDSQYTKIRQQETELLDEEARLTLAIQTEQEKIEAEKNLLSEKQAKLDSLQAEKATAEAERKAVQAQIDECSRLEEKIAQLRKDYGKAERELEEKILAGEYPYRICYLTFDDGPSYYTDRFVNKLAELDAYATFFTIGVQISEEDAALRTKYLQMEALGGHTIANHTYSHAYYGPVYESVDSFVDAVQEQDALVYEATGLHTDIVRFPAGSYYCPQREDTIEALHEHGYRYIDWSSNSYDAGEGHSVEYTISAILYQVRQEQISVLLMHDWILNTLNSLDSVVTTLRAENYVFLPLFPESTMVETAFPGWDTF